MFDEPIRLTKALQAINARKDRTTHLKSREIAMAWNAEARARAFFSARVASATILSELHNKVQAVVEGRMTKGQARALLQRYFVGEGADALAALGFAPQGEGGGVAELASAARLRLILDMNVNMAQECGEYRRWAEMKDIYRYGMWKCGYAKEHREEHLARDGKVYAFDHPIWTESPPGGEFNCHCYRVLLREEDVIERGITPEPMGVPFAPSSLGFDPSRGMQKPEFGKRVRKEYREIAERQMAKFTQAQQQAQPEEEDKKVHALPIKDAMERKADLAKELQDKAKAVVEENVKREAAIISEIENISAQIKEVIDENVSLPVVPDGVWEKIHKLQDERKNIYKRLDENKSRRYIELSDAFSVPEDNRMRMKITVPKRSVVKAKVDEAQGIIEKMTSMKLGFAKDDLAVQGKKAGTRSRYLPGDRRIEISSNSEIPIVAHEMAHWLEDSSEHVHERCVEFLDYRCGKEISEKLSKLTGDKRYKPHETARKDKFFNPYCGKDYFDRNGQRSGTEILSMGLERILEKPLQFMQEDPEYFCFVLLLLRGAI